MFAKALLTTALISAVSAHQNWHQLWINDVSPGYQTGIRMPPSNSPVTDLTSNDLACNVGGSKVPSGVETVAAKEGDSIKVQWDSSGHPGPITHFLYGPVDDASQATGVGAGWFKIDELDAVNGEWANAIMMANNMTHEFKLPTGLASGEYLLRSEMLALHGSQTIGGAQFYIGCAQLKIVGTGTKGACGPTISLPGAYKAEDANIYIPNVYNGFDISTYSAPGGPVASCDGSGASTPVATSAPAAGNSTVVPSATAAPVASSVAPTSVAAETPEATEAATTVAETPVAEPTVTDAPVPDYSSVESPPIVEITSAPAASGVIPAPSGNVTSALPTLIPTTFATLVRPSSQAAAPTGGSSSGAVKLYYKCGGIGYTGPTACADGATCVKQNDYYSQCLRA